MTKKEARDFWFEGVKILGYMLVGAAMMGWAIDYFRIGYDSTDGEERSGLGLHTDAMTGCQYLSRSGGLTPRLDAKGNHICHD